MKAGKIEKVFLQPERSTFINMLNQNICRPSTFTFIYFLSLLSFLVKIFPTLNYAFVKSVFSTKKCPILNFALATQNFSGAPDCGTSLFFTYQPLLQMKVAYSIEW